MGGVKLALRGQADSGDVHGVQCEGGRCQCRIVLSGASRGCIDVLWTWCVEGRQVVSNRPAMQRTAHAVRQHFLAAGLYRGHLGKTLPAVGQLHAPVLQNTARGDFFWRLEAPAGETAMLYTRLALHHLLSDNCFTGMPTPKLPSSCSSNLPLLHAPACITAPHPAN